ncbi:hypothetical protein OESDEN_01050, partial [Oesophagostomum dentatum]
LWLLSIIKKLLSRYNQHPKQICFINEFVRGKRHPYNYWNLLASFRDGPQCSTINTLCVTAYFLASIVCCLSNLQVGILLEEVAHYYIREAILLTEQALHERGVAAFGACRFHPIFAYLNASDHEQIRAKVCELMEAGATVIIGPPQREFGQFIEPVCRELGVPFVKFHWDPVQEPATSEISGSSTVNLSPLSQFSLLLDKLLLHWKWDYFTFVYTNRDGKRFFS